MSSNSKAKAETLEQRTARVSTEAEQVRAEHERIAADKATKLQARQRAYDEAVVGSYRRADGDVAVEKARRDLDHAVADLPVTQAIAALLAAQTAAYNDWHEYLAARGRLGIPTQASQPPPVGAVLQIGDYVSSAADRLAHEAFTRSREESQRNRNGTETP